jgi:hypothetical protein
MVGYAGVGLSLRLRDEFLHASNVAVIEGSVKVICEQLRDYG